MSGDVSKQIKCSFIRCYRFASRENKLTYCARDGERKVLGVYCDTHFAEVVSTIVRGHPSYNDCRRKKVSGPRRYGKQVYVRKVPRKQRWAAFGKRKLF